MANPTGTVYLQANNSYVWTDGDVYEIPQTDQSEGAAIGASFGGLGVDNQPHEALLNKAQLLHKNQLADEANIYALQTILTLTSAVGLNGWMKLSSNDVNLGQIYPILQWGTISVLPYGGPSNKAPVLFPFSFPIAFPNAVWVLLAYAESNNAGGSNQPEITFMPITPLQKQNNQMAWLTGASGAFPTIAYAPGGTVGLTGIGWVALGY